ncbi:carboxymuconolactone decarboxylase family protein [Nonomuraea dietziae]|uniref:carboxymuconolactone decarboxylase family protein n=1 Tax=Nonomuraea dietziae TaxID=65515 RepID=UPI0033E5BA44
MCAGSGAGPTKEGTWDSGLFDELERRVLEYAEAMSETPPSVTGEMVTGLLGHLTEGQLVELTAMVAIENQRARTYHALGVTAQGFKAYCEVTDRPWRPPPPPSGHGRGRVPPGGRRG